MNNAGSAGHGATVQVADPGFNAYFDASLEMSVNVRGTLYSMNAQLPHMSGTAGMLAVSSIQIGVVTCVREPIVDTQYVHVSCHVCT